MIKLVWTILLFVGIVSANTFTAPLLIQPEGSKETFPHGSVTFNSQNFIGNYSPEPRHEFEGRACIGLEDKDGVFKCLAYGNIKKSSNGEVYTIHLNKGGDTISKIDYARDDKLNDDDEVKVHVQKQRIGPQPQLKEPVKLDDDGKLPPEEEAPKTFLQKYWMYILPLVLFMMASGGGAQ